MSERMTVLGVDVERVVCSLPCYPPVSSENPEPKGTVPAVAFCTAIASGSMAHAVGAQVLAEGSLHCPAAARALAACLWLAAEEAEHGRVSLPESEDVFRRVKALGSPSRVLKAAADRIGIEDFERSRRAWSRRTFGDRGPLGPLRHLRKEIDEVIAAWEYGDRAAVREEFADLGLLLADALDRAGIMPEMHLADLKAKLAVNEAREWPPAVKGEPCEHVREEEEEARFDVWMIAWREMSAREKLQEFADRQCPLGETDPALIEACRQFLELHEAWDTNWLHFCCWYAPDGYGVNIHWITDRKHGDNVEANFHFPRAGVWHVSFGREDESGESLTKILGRTPELHRVDEFADFLQQWFSADVTTVSTSNYV